MDKRTNNRLGLKYRDIPIQEEYKYLGFMIGDDCTFRIQK